MKRLVNLLQPVVVKAVLASMVEHRIDVTGGVDATVAGYLESEAFDLVLIEIARASNQVEYSLLHRQPESNGVLDACRKLGITLIAYTPLAGGALTGKYSATRRASGLRRFMPNFSRKTMEALQPVIALLRQIGERYSKTPSQVALRWLIENPVVLPIPGAKNSKQAIENAGALSFALTPEEVNALSQATLAWRK